MRVLTSVGLAAVYGVFGMTVVYVLGTIPMLASFVEAAGTPVSTVAWVFGLAGAGLVLAIAMALLIAMPMLLTGTGARRRGNAWPLVVLSALVFPLTWAVWYVRDEHPYAKRGTN